MLAKRVSSDTELTRLLREIGRTKGKAKVEEVSSGNGSYNPYQDTSNIRSEEEKTYCWLP